MKKVLCLLVSLALITTAAISPVSANVGDKAGDVLYTDIGAYINNFPITSYNINGYTAVVAEDLANYGFIVTWNPDERTLTVTNGGEKISGPASTIYKNTAKKGQAAMPYLETDIVTFVSENPVQAFNIDGRTIIFIDDLAAYGNVQWIEQIRAIKLTLPEFPITEYHELPEAAIDTVGCYENSTIYDYTYITGVALSSRMFMSGGGLSNDETYYLYTYDAANFELYLSQIQNNGYKVIERQDNSFGGMSILVLSNGLSTFTINYNSEKLFIII